jgi:hypothetical protein
MTGAQLLRPYEGHSDPNRRDEPSVAHTERGQALENACVHLMAQYRSDGLRAIHRKSAVSTSRCLPRAADRDPIHAQRRLPDAHRHALAVLAARADAGIEGEVVADHADPVEIGRPVADQHRAFE